MSDLTPIKQDVEEVLYNFQEIKVETNDEYTQAGDFLKQIQTKIKKIEAKRVEYTKPLDESKKRIMADFKALTEPLEVLVGEIKSKMTHFYKQEQIRLADEQAKREAEALAKAKEEGVSEVTVEVVEQPKSQVGEVATTTVKKVWKWEFEDASKVPHEYFTIDEKKINQAVRDGVREIAGIRIYQEDQLSVR